MFPAVVWAPATPCSSGSMRSATNILLINLYLGAETQTLTAPSLSKNQLTVDDIPRGRNERYAVYDGAGRESFHTFHRAFAAVRAAIVHPDLEQAISFHESIVAEGGKAL